MFDTETDNRCWHELPFDELAAEAITIGTATGDSVLLSLADALLTAMSQDAADLVIDRIEDEHAE